MPNSDAAPVRARRGQDWRGLVAVFWVTSMVEGLGVAQIFAFLPVYLRGMGSCPSICGAWGSPKTIAWHSSGCSRR
jgi:hypothetical protein